MYKLMDHPLEMILYELVVDKWVEIAKRDGVIDECSHGPDIYNFTEPLTKISENELEGDWTQTIYVNTTTTNQS